MCAKRDQSDRSEECYRREAFMMVERRKVVYVSRGECGVVLGKRVPNDCEWESVESVECES